MKRLAALTACLCFAFAGSIAADDTLDDGLEIHDDHVHEHEHHDKTVVMAWPVFTHTSKQDHAHTNFLNLGLAKVYSRERHQTETETEVGGVLWAKLFGLDRDVDEAELEIVDLGLAEFLEVENRGERGHSVRFIDIPLASVFESERHDDFSENKFLNLPIVGSLFRNRTDGDKKELELFYFITLKNYD